MSKQKIEPLAEYRTLLASGGALTPAGRERLAELAIALGRAKSGPGNADEVARNDLRTTCEYTAIKKLVDDLPERQKTYARLKEQADALERAWLAAQAAYAPAQRIGFLLTAAIAAKCEAESVVADLADLERLHADLLGPLTK